uniref:Transposase-associated domain-containing protein n=1 Tax=Cajanus cajan TaxID=3821 RepID=A0A151QUM2_CAJCA|nr:hypothetical protein KK1_045064 [Cajanus cajan]
MSASRLSKEYEDGVKEFRRFVVEHAKDPSRIICPCLKCCHSKLVNADVLEEHLVCNGIDKSYSCWTKHGETKNHIFAEHNANSSLISNRLRWLANGPTFQVFSYTAYMINGYTFYTKERDDKSTMQNSGVTLVAKSMHISSAKDRTPIYANMSYFGVIEHIWELDYKTFQVPIFGCKWVDNNSGVRQDETGFMQVNFNKVGYKDEPFILASQAQQVFYVTDPIDANWSIVLLTNKINDHQNEDIEDEDTNVEDDPLYEISHILDDDPTVDDILYRRDDHDEGIWINPSFCVHKKQKKF